MTSLVLVLLSWHVDVLGKSGISVQWFANIFIKLFLELLLVDCEVFSGFLMTECTPELPMFSA